MRIFSIVTGGLCGSVWASLAVVVALASASPAPLVATIIEPMQPNVWPGGRAVAVTVSPNNSSIAIVASESGGLFKTLDGGLTWSHLTGLPPFRMADVKYSPATSQRVVATAYADSRTGNRGGIWRSLNGGINWEKAATSNPTAGPKCPAAANAYGISYVGGGIYVGTDCGLAISRDSGATWTHAVPDPAAANRRIVSVVAHGQGIVDVCGDAGIYRSTTSGATWGPASPGVGGCTQLGTHLIDVSPFNSNVLFVTTFLNKLLESGNGGRTWTTLNPPAAVPGRPSWLAVSKALPASPNQFEIFFGNPYNRVRQTCTNRSGLNCNGSWTALNLNPPNDHETNAFAFDASGSAGKFIVTDGGVFNSTDGGQTFAVGGGGTGGYNALQIYEVAGQIHPDHTDLFFGTQDNCLWASPDEGRNWINPRCPEGFALQMKRNTISHTNEIITGADMGWGNFKSSDHFVTFDHWNDPPNNAGNPFLIDTGKYIQYTRAPGSPATGIALTLNTGGSWNPVRVGTTATPFTIAPSLVHFPQIVGPPANPRIWQAVTRPGSNPAGPNVGLIRIDLDVANRGATWANADGSGSGSLGSLGTYGPGQGTFTIPAVFGADPGDPQHAIATDVASGQMKVTQDGGATWMAMTALTDLILDGGRFQFSVPGGPLQVHTIGFNPDDTRQVLVGTEAAGIFESADGGQSWAKIPFSDYFIRSISNFFFDRDRVIVATYGNGLWKLVPGSFPPPVLCPNFPFPCRIDVRTLIGERIYPRWACPHPPDLPTCQVYGLEKGIIEDLTLSKEGELKALALNEGTEGKLDAYDIDGKRIDPSLPVKPATATRPGEFSGCPGCLGILAEGGSITGFIYAEDRVTAVIGRFPDELAGKGAFLAADAPGRKEEQPATGPLPYLQLVGPLKVTGQPTAATGDAVQVYGSGFCAAPGCSSITLRIGNRVAAKSVKVDGKGSFKATVKVTELPGQYRVSATQKNETGEVLRDERTLVVPILEGDEE
ncbi:MAG: hypothetical protein QOH06_4562 [Acidobacteriota bacterium]|nr:hypothetical protein [Acidobacteriota bacterium]